MTTSGRWSRDQRVRWRRLDAVLRAHADTLATQGSLASQLANRRRVWQLRFAVKVNGQRRQRAVYVGADPRLLERVRARLALLRDRRGWARDAVDLDGVLGRLRALVCPSPRP